MSRLKTLNWILLALLGVAGGTSKMLQIPQEMAFFQGEMGYNTDVIVAFGFLQFVAGVALVFKKTRLAAAVLLGLTLFISSIVVFMGGKIVFGVISLIPVLMADLLVWLEVKAMSSA